MERTAHFFQYQHAKLHYTRYGTGEKVLFCFHGFGLTGEAFFELETSLAKEYTIYNFDLFFHGKSEWNKGEGVLTEQFWKELLTVFTKEQGIAKFSLLGYSIGARLVWSTVTLFPNQVEGIITLAPDGITISNWYKIATGTLVNRKLFKFLLFHHHRIYFLLKLANRFRLAPAVTIRFAEGQLANAAQRQRAYYTWVVYRQLKADKERVASIINEKAIPFTMYLGKMDKIITFKKVNPLVRLIKKASVKTLEAGHSNLISAVKEELRLVYFSER